MLALCLLLALLGRTQEWDLMFFTVLITLG